MATGSWTDIFSTVADAYDDSWLEAGVDYLSDSATSEGGDTGGGFFDKISGGLDKVKGIANTAADIGGYFLNDDAIQDVNQAQQQAVQQAEDTTRYMYDQSRADLAPYRDTGIAANKRLSELMGIGQFDREAIKQEILAKQQPQSFNSAQQDAGKAANSLVPNNPWTERNSLEGMTPEQMLATISNNSENSLGGTGLTAGVTGQATQSNNLGTLGKVLQGEHIVDKFGGAGWEYDADWINNLTDGKGLEYFGWNPETQEYSQAVDDIDGQGNRGFYHEPKYTGTQGYREAENAAIMAKVQPMLDGMEGNIKLDKLGMKADGTFPTFAEQRAIKEFSANKADILKGLTNDAIQHNAYLGGQQFNRRDYIDALTGSDFDSAVSQSKTANYDPYPSTKDKVVGGIGTLAKIAAIAAATGGAGFSAAGAGAAAGAGGFAGATGAGATAAGAATGGLAGAGGAALGSAIGGTAGTIAGTATQYGIQAAIAAAQRRAGSI